MDPRVTTWSGLLAVWTDFARAAGALPKSGDLGLLRRSVPAIIGLQSLTHALEHIDTLPPDEYSSGQDRAALITRTLRAELESIWRADAMPAALAEMMSEAEAALERTRGAGYEFIPERDPFVMPLTLPEFGAWRDRRGFRGQVFSVAAGKRVRAGVPVVFVAGVGGRPLPRADLLDLGSLLPGCLWGRAQAMRQVYETPEAKGLRQSVGAPGLGGTALLKPIEQAGAESNTTGPAHNPAARIGSNGALNARGSL
ncbi:MAG: hypothetical protein J0L78_14370 [Planctomycetes bacterium]|nr:hypothetical protein [Planctomycetota bacterium]